MMLKFKTGSRANPTRVLIPVSKILKVVENPPIEDQYEDYIVGQFDFHDGKKRFFTATKSFNKYIIIQDLDENETPIGGERDWETLSVFDEEYKKIFEEQKQKTYPEWKIKMADIYCPSSVYLDSAGVDGKGVIHVFETVDQILEGV